MTPEEEEIKKREHDLLEVEEALAQIETEYADHRVQLKNFEQAYILAVQSEHIELARWEGLIAHQISRVEALQAMQDGVVSVPDNPYSWAHFVPLSEPTMADEPEVEQPELVSNVELKTLYRELARRFHPDLAENESIREEREIVMREINAAYQEGNIERLVQISHRPAIVDPEQESVGDRLVWLIRRQAEVEQLVESSQAKLNSSCTGSLSMLMIQCLSLPKEIRFESVRLALLQQIGELKQEWAFHRQQESELWQGLL